MSEKSFIGSNLQIPSGVRWGGNGTLADQTGATTCKYLMQVIDQNGDPILARQLVKLSLCARASNSGTDDTGLGPLTPTATEITTSLSVAQAATVLIATTAVAAANDYVKVGSEDPNGTMHFAYEPTGTAGVIGVHGLVQNVRTVVGGANLSETTFITDTEGKFSFQVVTADDTKRALVIELASGKVLYFKIVRAA